MKTEPVSLKKQELVKSLPTLEHVKPEVFLSKKQKLVKMVAALDYVKYKPSLHKKQELLLHHTRDPILHLRSSNSPLVSNSYFQTKVAEREA